MKRRGNSISVCVHVEEEVDVEVEIDDIIESLDDESRPKLLAALGAPSVMGAGDGDVAFARNTVMRAEMAVRRMREVPRELADLFWHVHGVAL